MPAGTFTLCQNLWGADEGVGSQNSTFISSSGNSVSWSTSYTWANNENNVKSYANVQSNSVAGILLSDLASAPTTYDWTYETSSSGLRADVSYDIWLGPTSNGLPASTNSAYEIMIWLSGEGGIQPVGQSIETGISLANETWTLWNGPNTNWQVFSFVAANGNINNFSGDLVDFFDFLVQNHGVSDSLYLQAVESGTEPFTGTATLMISDFSVSATTGSSGSSGGGGGGGSGTTTAPSAPSSTGTVTEYGQCGGIGYTGPTACASPNVCTELNAYYSQCLSS